MPYTESLGVLVPHPREAYSASPPYPRQTVRVLSGCGAKPDRPLRPIIKWVLRGIGVYSIWQKTRDDWMTLSGSCHSLQVFAPECSSLTLRMVGRLVLLLFVLCLLFFQHNHLLKSSFQNARMCARSCRCLSHSKFTSLNCRSPPRHYHPPNQISTQFARLERRTFFSKIYCDMCIKHMLFFLSQSDLLSYFMDPIGQNV